MKIINEKGRLFGIINVVDLAVLIIVVLVAFAAVVKLSGGNIKAPIASAKKEVAITLKAPSKSSSLLTAFNKGDQLMYGKLFIDAYIQNVELTPTMVNVQLPTGEIIPTPDPVFKDIFITFTSKVDAGQDVLVIGNSEIRIGTTYNINTKSASTACYVMKIEYTK